jgi:hypothetical protein
MHKALRITPAMHMGITDYIWAISELIEAALSKGSQMQVKRATGELQLSKEGVLSQRQSNHDVHSICR